jgi:hypothetical protein
MDEIAAFLASSYGPRGKTKIIKLPTGHCMITRDGKQLLEALIDNRDPSQYTPLQLFTKLLLKDCKMLGETFGDGSMGSFLLCSEFLSLQNAFQADRMDRLLNTEMTRRRNLLALLLHTMSTSETAVVECLIRSGVWLELTESGLMDAEGGINRLRSMLQSVLRNALIPSATPSMAALVEKIMVQCFV